MIRAWHIPGYLGNASYKVDRLTRSLADFAKLVELFDQYGVSFVSITQSFNTTSSMGRLTLNVLLSFAQFEREVIGERVRDKIAASKRKGLWVGGPASKKARNRARGGRDGSHHLQPLSRARLHGRFDCRARPAGHPDQGQWPPRWPPKRRYSPPKRRYSLWCGAACPSPQEPVLHRRGHLSE